MYMRKPGQGNLSIPENYGGTSLLESVENGRNFGAEEDYLGTRGISPEIRTPSPPEEDAYRKAPSDERIEEEENAPKPPSTEENPIDTSEAEESVDAAASVKDAPSSPPFLLGMDTSDILLIVLAALLLKDGNGGDEIAILLLILLLG